MIEENKIDNILSPGPAEYSFLQETTASQIQLANKCTAFTLH